ncbi:hypothetical protein AJ88_00895 [Mesorhizobium amorphae CCBAU 01583]|nr:hypothetical protein AJ88_00895 [Mesorhizobium amorphae CCBAU 01583]
MEFNPARLTAQAWKDLRLFLQTTVDPTPSAFMNNGRVTRIDLAVDLPGMEVGSVIIQTTKKKKVGVYSDQSGEPQTVYLGAPTGKNRVVAYTKINKATGVKSVRVECRVNPKCHGSDLQEIANPFASITLVPTSVLDGIDLGMPPVFLADSIRLRGLARALKLLPHGKRKLVEYALVSGEALCPTPMTSGWSSPLSWLRRASNQSQSQRNEIGFKPVTFPPTTLHPPHLKRRDLLSVEETATLFGVSVRTVRRWHASGHLPIRRLKRGHRQLYVRAEIEVRINGNGRDK